MDVTAGIGVEEMRVIERDQFDHYVAEARAMTDLADVRRVRSVLLGALNAAYGLDTIWLQRDRGSEEHRIQERLEGVRAAIDAACHEHDLQEDWPGFVDDLWQRTTVSA